jgi:hypothetical protein
MAGRSAEINLAEKNGEFSEKEGQLMAMNQPKGSRVELSRVESRSHTTSGFMKGRETGRTNEIKRKIQSNKSKATSHLFVQQMRGTMKCN